ncbi:helix-turn-helix domain-containing protein, partial [Candidatus Amesbacteria bacterium]|nr:helix-turn-helix domain-containing protein [Candidatus Amesbacteria bacterium]
MKAAGQILQAARVSRKCEFEDVARITKIRPNFLSAIEADDYVQLPSGTVARGFIRNYCECLGLNPETVLAVFRRDFIENSLGRIVPRGLADPVAKPSLWTPKTTIVAVVIFVFILFGAYIVYQYRQRPGPPSLILASAIDRLSTSEANVELIGRTDPDAS